MKFSENWKVPGMDYLRKHFIEELKTMVTMRFLRRN
jgi:hypothetical protein